MLFLVKAENVPGTAGSELRLTARDAHVSYLNEHRHRFIGSGPMLSDDGEQIVGTLMILDMPDRAALDAFMREEPYNKAGLLEKIEIRRWRFGSADTNRKDVTTQQ